MCKIVVKSEENKKSLSLEKSLSPKVLMHLFSGDLETKL